MFWLHIATATIFFTALLPYCRLILKRLPRGQPVRRRDVGADSGEGRHQRHAHAHGRLLVERAVIGSNDFIHERHHAASPAHGFPEALFHPFAALSEPAIAFILRAILISSSVTPFSLWVASVTSTRL
ncbi:hypothetical protein C043_00010 [Brucella abortus 80/101]|nr:hypothetical protein C043_00010 [Brucella abortus 80/101]